MPCTTILAGKNATNDGSTMIARTDDGHFDVKKFVVVKPNQKQTIYKSKIAHLSIKLPDHPMRYTACPSVDPKNGIWAATGINEANVGMTATETITSNPRVLAADPLVTYEKAKRRGEHDKPGGIGEEDFVVLVLPYIKSAREGVLRIAQLLEKYGTYESNGIALNDAEEVWWLETIGGHHYMARKVPDERVVIAPNQFAMDEFDFDDALSEGRNHLCSEDLKEFIEANSLNLNQDGLSNPRYIFGSHDDSDHVYNTPRAWFMGRYLAPSLGWDGPNAAYHPESDNIPWSLVPDKKVTIEDIKYLLSSYYQGTPYNPYANHDTGMRGMYRSIGINRTGVTSICQIRGNMPKALQGVEWISFASNAFNAMLPFYVNTDRMPVYVSNVTMEPSTENLYWSSAMIGALADPCYPTAIQLIERYQDAVMTKGRRLLSEYDQKMCRTENFSLIQEANEKLAEMAKQETAKALGEVLHNASLHMKNGYNRADN